MNERASHWLGATTQDLARERKARVEAEAVLADTTRARAALLHLALCIRAHAGTGSSPHQAYSALREHQALVLSEQGELQATVSQMRDEIKAKDAELAKLKPDHRPSFWSEPKQVRLGRRPRWRAPLTRVHPRWETAAVPRTRA